MEELNFLKDYGWQGVFAYLIIKYGHIVYKKHVSGNYVSYKDIKNQNDRTWDHLKYLEDKVSDIALKQQEDAVLIAKIQSEQAHVREMFAGLKATLDRLEHGQQKAFDLISGFKDRFIK